MLPKNNKLHLLNKIKIMSTPDDLIAITSKAIQKKKQIAENEKIKKFESTLSIFRTKLATLQNDGSLKKTAKAGKNSHQVMKLNGGCEEFTSYLNWTYEGFGVDWTRIKSGEDSCNVHVIWYKKS